MNFLYLNLLCYIFLACEQDPGEDCKIRCKYFICCVSSYTKKVQGIHPCIPAHFGSVIRPCKLDCRFHAEQT